MQVSSDKVTPLQVWNLVTSIKLHFEGKFDAIKYRFSMKSLSAQAFEIRKDRYYFEKLARRHSDFNECLWYSAANVMVGNRWIGSMNEEPYVALQSYHESMIYRFGEEMKSLARSEGSLDRLLISIDNQPPRILKAVASGTLSIHAAAILEALAQFLNREMPKISDPLGLWEEHHLKIEKYAQLLSWDSRIFSNSNRKSLRDVVIKSFTSD